MHYASNGPITYTVLHIVAIIASFGALNKEEFLQWSSEGVLPCLGSLNFHFKLHASFREDV